MGITITKRQVKNVPVTDVYFNGARVFCVIPNQRYGTDLYEVYCESTGEKRTEFLSLEYCTEWISNYFGKTLSF